MASTLLSPLNEEAIDAKKKALREDIDAKKRFIACLPDWSDLKSRTSQYYRANYTKQLAEKEYEYELLLESERIASVVREHEELHLPYTMECPICLEDIPIRSERSMAWFLCCGNGACAKCKEAEDEDGRLNNKCPLCRAKFPKSEVEATNRFKRCAENGKCWAQVVVGNYYMNGINGFQVDTRKAFQWFTLAAEQMNPNAMYNLAHMYEEGKGVEQSYSKAQELLTEAANLGVSDAQRLLARRYDYGKAGLSVNKSKALYYISLCCSQEGNPVGDYYLGRLYYNGECGLKKSLHLAKHYFGRAAEGGCGLAYEMYGLVLLELWGDQYKIDECSRVYLPGHCAIPRALYWYRKAATNGRSNATLSVKDLEGLEKQFCSYCRIEASTMNATFKCCAKCKAAWYCGRDCQVAAWKEGHKVDCVKHE